MTWRPAFLPLCEVPGCLRTAPGMMQLCQNHAAEYAATGINPALVVPIVPAAGGNALDLTPDEAGAEAMLAITPMLRELRESLGGPESRVQSALAEKHRVLSLIARAGERQ